VGEGDAHNAKDLLSPLRLQLSVERFKRLKERSFKLFNSSTLQLFRTLARFAPLREILGSGCGAAALGASW
jgi:hypothetical protein